MIIGNNNSFNNDNNNFTNKFNTIKENGNKMNPVAPMSNEANRYTNINDRSQVADKSFQILKDRLDNGLISLEEFNKKCQQINKLKQK